MTHKVSFGAMAGDDLTGIYDWLLEQAGPPMALDHVSRIMEACMTLADYPERGTPRDQIWAGLRTIPFRKSATIAYLVDGGTVRIIRIVHRGRELSVSEDDL